MHQFQQQNVPLVPLLAPPQPQLQQLPEVPIPNGNNIINPLLNGCTTMVTNTNINVTYLNGAINGVKQYEVEKFKMHQGFIAVLKVNSDHLPDQIL